MSIRVTKNGIVKTFHDDALAQICSELAGNVYSSAHTLKAMTIKAQYERTGKVRARGFTVVKIDDSTL